MGRPTLAFATLAAYCRAKGYPEPVPEHRFHPRRKWAFDAAFTGAMVAVEFEGGVWTQGRHTRGKGFTGDAEKYGEAAVLGWRVLRVTYGQFDAGLLWTWLDAIFGEKAVTP
jgi:hypothetical protein